MESLHSRGAEDNGLCRQVPTPRMNPTAHYRGNATLPFVPILTQINTIQNGTLSFNVGVNVVGPRRLPVQRLGSEPDGQEMWVRFPECARDCSLLQIVARGHGAYPAWYPIGLRVHSQE
jgi:hypothetical protein